MSDPIEQFIHLLRHGLNRRLLWRRFWYYFVAALVAMTLWAFFRRVQGQPAEWQIYGGIAAAFGICWGGHCCCRRYTLPMAARYGDAFFRLHDALLSHLEFRGRSGSFQCLRQQQTLEICRSLSVKQLPWYRPRRSVPLALLLLIAVLGGALLPPSPAVRAAAVRAAELREETGWRNAELRREVTELQRQLSEAERELFEDAGIADLIGQFTPQGDWKDALRQYGQLDQKLAALEYDPPLAADRQLLQRLAKAMQQHAAGRQLGKLLSQEEYAAAAEELEALQLSGTEGVSRQQKLAKLREMLQSYSSRGDRKSSTALEREVEALLRRLANRDDGAIDNRQIDASLQKISSRLQQMQNMTQLLAKLTALRQALNRAQNGVGQNRTAQAGRSRQPDRDEQNARGAGSGDGNRELSDRQSGQETDSGNFQSVEAAVGDGAADRRITETAAGSGTAGRARRELGTAYQRQLESFIRRSDVPENLKTDVKNYFISIHQPQGGAEDE